MSCPGCNSRLFEIAKTFPPIKWRKVEKQGILKRCIHCSTLYYALDDVNDKGKEIPSKPVDLYKLAK